MPISRADDREARAPPEMCAAQPRSFLDSLAKRVRLPWKGDLCSETHFPAPKRDPQDRRGIAALRSKGGGGSIASPWR